MNTQERDRLGRIVRDLWISWAESQPNPKPSWLVPYDQLSDTYKEADIVIGVGLMHEFYAETTGERMRFERLMQLAVVLRDELHSFRELYDSTCPITAKAIADFDEFVSGVELINRSKTFHGN
jgi:hypothetical protein